MIDPLQLHAYTDGELAPEEKAAFETELLNDPAAQQEIASIQSLKLMLSQKVSAVECQAEWKGCVGRLKEIDKTRQVEGVVGRYAWALCGAFFCMIVIGGIARRGAGDRVQSADLASMAASFHAGSNHTPVRAGEDKALAELLHNAAISVAPGNIRVLNAMRGTLGDRPAVKFGLRDAQGDMALVLIQSQLGFDDLQPMPGQPPMYSGKLGELNCVAWVEGNRSFVLVGERDANALREVGSRLKIQ